MELNSPGRGDARREIPPGRNIALRLAYDGTPFCGWQVQPNGPTLQAALQKAIFKLTGETVTVYSAGRTDSGVHALGQVANFFSQSPIPPTQFAAALQTHLPPEIQLLQSWEAPPEFHATFTARWKRYRYLIHNGPQPVPFLRHRCWWLRRRLDVEAMQSAADQLLGTHDFRCFETEWPNKTTSVRTIHELNLFRRPLWEVWQPFAVPRANLSASAPPRDDSLICLEISADGFLYNMVRAITGTLVNVGRGRWTPADVARILMAQDRNLAGATAPAEGLYLVQVEYQHHWPHSSEAASPGTATRVQPPPRRS
jgi:tRNA pseudouridine38-40 synthase